MNQFQLYRSIARATDETVDVVRQIGFTMLDPIAPEVDEAEQWLRRAQQKRSFKHGKHAHHRQTCVAR